MPKIAPKEAVPFWFTTDRETVRLYQGNVTDVLARLPERSVHMCVTSPPYWGLRSYLADGHNEKHLELGSEPSPDCKTDGQAQCGACFVCNMVAVFRGVYRVLRDDGTCWLNLGDSYSGGKTGRSDDGSGDPTSRLGPKRDGLPNNSGMGPIKQRPPSPGIPSGNVVGVPWRVALALQADGWILRQDIIWHKPSPMPESVRNRCTKAHEYVFLLAKRPGYFYDAEAVKEKSAVTDPNDPSYRANGKTRTSPKMVLGLDASHGRDIGPGVVEPTRNKRSVWSVSSQGYEGAHFATFPPKLIEPMILAGTSAHGCCADCGAPWRRVTEETKLRRERPNDFVKRTGAEGTGNSCSNSVAGVAVETVGWEPTCECHGTFVKRKATKTVRVIDSTSKKSEDRLNGGMNSSKTTLTSGEPAGRSVESHEEEAEIKVEEYVSDLQLGDHPVVPCTVLDPFIGSGTACAVSLEHGRRSVGIDLSERYLLDNAVPRIEGVLLSVPATAHLAGRTAKKVTIGKPAAERKSLK